MYMTFAHKFVTSILLVVLLIVQGCTRKKAGLPPTPSAPTIAATLPDSIPPIEEEPQQPEPQVAETPPPVEPTKTKPKKPSRISGKKTNPSTPPPPANSASPAQGNQTLASVRPPANPADTPQTVIAAAVPSSQVNQQKVETTRMVDATENALKGLNRSLSDDEKSMKSQIQSYLQQSRKATTDGDYERAFNLAKKAQLLADALLKK